MPTSESTSSTNTPRSRTMFLATRSTKTNSHKLATSEKDKYAYMTQLNKNKLQKLLNNCYFIEIFVKTRFQKSKIRPVAEQIDLF